MHWKNKWLIGSALAASCFAPAWAGSGITDPENLVEFSVYGSFWDTANADQNFGFGLKLGFAYARFVEVEIHASHFPGFEAEEFPTTSELKVSPLDGGLRCNIIPEGRVNPYVGGGVTYFFLDSGAGDLEGESGWYGEAGLDAGSDHFRFFTEVMWRQPKGTITLEGVDTDVHFDGAAVNVGVTVRWGN